MAFRTNKVPAIEERTVSGSSVSFNSAFALPLKACKVSFSATQAGSGDPSPSNPRAISGVSSIGLTANSTPVSVSLGDTRYGGELDLLTGELIVTKKIVNLSTITGWNYNATYNRFYSNQQTTDYGAVQKSTDMAIFDNVITSNDSALPSAFVDNFNRIFIRNTGYTEVEPFVENIINGHYAVVTMKPQIIQLSANELSSIIGNNTFSTDTGTLEITFADLQEKSASGSVATFNTALAMPLSSCNIAVNAWQEGSGDPSPSNVRAIHGFDKANVIRSGKTYQHEGSKIVIEATQEGSGEPSPSNVRPIHAGLTIVRDDDSVFEVYGGTLDVVSGELSVTNALKILNGGTSEVWYFRELSNGYYHVISQMKRQTLGNGISNWLKRVNSLNNEFGIAFGYNNSAIYAVKANTLEGVTDVNSWKQYLSNHNLQVVYELETPEVIQLSATELARAKEALGIDTYTIQLGDTYYGGSLDVTTGVLSVNMYSFVMDGDTNKYASPANWYSVDVADSNPTFGAYWYFNGRGFDNFPKPQNVSADRKMLCETFQKTNGVYKQTVPYSMGIAGISNAQYFGVRIPAADLLDTSSSSALTNSIMEWFQNNPTTFYYEIKTPITVQLTPTQIATIIGNNTIFADTGDIDLTYKDLDIAKRGNFREVFKLPS